ncbi:Uncharacterised protein [Chromobacterium violaceum]|uniref:Uncharacterized protein n=1 Tax=Chromobacterium violaceum TaxID=536 RepID=A0A447TEL6_CHRVL|nr:Uncharacterised protein [Chromobacterium violaceum]
MINLELLYSWGASVRMALLTALGIIAASLGLYGWRSRRRAGTRARRTWPIRSR